MPDESTIRKITRRCGPELIDALNVELLTAAHQRGGVSLERVGVDTTVVEADIKYPTDSGLLTAATCRIASRLHRLAKVGVRVAYVDRSAAARAHQHSIGVWLRRRSDEAKSEVLAITGLLADLAECSVAEAMNRAAAPACATGGCVACWRTSPCSSNARTGSSPRPARV